MAEPARTVRADVPGGGTAFASRSVAAVATGARLPRVLFYLNHPSAAVEYLLIADALADVATVTILCASLPSARGIPAERRADHAVVDWDGAPMDWSRVDAALRVAYGEEAPPGWRRQLTRLGGLPLVGVGLQAGVATLRLLRARRAAGRLLDRERPDVLVVVGDRRLFTDMPILVEAKARHIPSVMVPFADGSPHTLVDYRRGMNDLKLGHPPNRLAKWLAAALSPRHVHESASGPLLFYSAADTLAMRLAGCSPHFPWILGASGRIDRVGVLGHVDKGYYDDYGLDHAHTHVVGQPSLDRLYEAGKATISLRAELDRRYDLDPDVPLIICGLPQAWTGVEGWSQQDYLALDGALAGCGANVLYSLHPKMRREDYPFLDVRERVRFSTGRLVDELPAADVYVASYSSTMRWSLLLRIPSIIADFPVYAAGRPPNPYPYLAVATEASSLAEWLRRVVGDPEFRDHVVRELEDVARATAPFDGRAARRLAELILATASDRT